MLKNIIYQLYAFLYFLPGFGQNINLQTIAELPEELPECSGLAKVPSGHMAMLNDGGNPAEIYFTDMQGRLLKKQPLDWATNVDWEDMAMGNNYLFIGDFGNNANARQDLKIYRVGIDKHDSLFDAGQIKFRYAIQDAYPPEENEQHFDLEAMVYTNDSLFLFSKNRTQPFSGITYLYGLPAQPGDYLISPLDSFKTGEGLRPAFWITGAAIHEGSRQLALLGYDKLWMFYDYPHSQFFRGRQKTFHFKDLSQKESIEFLSNDTLMITDERADSFGGGYLYKGHLSTRAAWPVITPDKVLGDSLTIEFPEAPEGIVLWEIYNTRGERVLAGNIPYPVSGAQTIDTKKLLPGGYVLNILIDGQPHAYKLKKVLETKETEAP